VPAYRRALGSDRPFVVPTVLNQDSLGFPNGLVHYSGAIVSKRLGLEASLYQILQILSLTLFEKTPILQALQATDSQSNLYDFSNQLILFDF
jgi:hypothetical protein